MVEVSSMIPAAARTRIVINPVITRGPAADISPNIGSLLQTLVPSPPANVLLLIKPHHNAALTSTAPPPAPALVPMEAPCNPLDLSCKKKQNDLSISIEPEPFPIRRANSCSTNSGLFTDEERRLKRKEQNKAAAQSYRQRKKSFSGMIETEFEKLTKKNIQLKAQKQKLEDQILKIRGLLNEVVEDNKRAEEAISDTASEPPPVQSPSWSMDGSSFGGDEPMRSRKYTWPMALNGKERKKEQNKLASRRFRQRRKQELSNCELEAIQLEKTNKRMKEQCDELESKIKLLKEIMNKNNAMLNSSGRPLLPIGETSATTAVTANALTLQQQQIKAE